MIGSTIERARHRWREILPLLGVDTKFLVNKHGPCPICGGRDRYRFDDKDGTGSYYCHQCGAGVGIILVRKLKRWNFKTACDEIDKILGNLRPSATPKTAPKNDPAAAERNIRRVLDEARSQEIVDAYLRRRGLSVTSPALRGHPGLAYFDADHKPAGRFPAILAPLLGPDGHLKTAHRIYDAPHLQKHERKKNMPVVGTINGGAVRLFDVDEELAIGEGIETMLAVHELFRVPVWACLTANGIKTFTPPPGLMRLHIYGDNDESFTGQLAAYALANRLGSDLIVEVHLPPIAGTDWLDHLNSSRG
jgi:putative DNA primase/helicase